jgi:hypothetical protein
MGYYINPINNSCNGCSTCSRYVSTDCWFFVNSSVIILIMAWSSIDLTHSSSSHDDGGGGGGGGDGPCFGGMVSKKQRATPVGYWLVKNNSRRWKHTLSLVSYLSLTSVLLTLQVAISDYTSTMIQEEV